MRYTTSAPAIMKDLLPTEELLTSVKKIKQGVKILPLSLGIKAGTQPVTPDPGGRLPVTLIEIDGEQHGIVMHAHHFCLAILLAAAVVLGFGVPIAAQTTRPAAINYKAIPNLEEVKDHPSAPDFTLANPDNKKISFKDFRGKLVFLNFWATWCAPCRDEMPAMERLFQEFKDKGFVILAISVKDSRKEALAFVKELKLTYPIAFDPEGKVGQDYGAWGLPATYLIDAKGIVLARAWGPADWYSPAARQLIGALLDGKK